MTDQAKNAIQWIERLLNYRKTTKVLGKRTKILGYEIGPMKYCCFGVACKILKLDTDYSKGYDNRLNELLGLKDGGGRFYVGDDTNFDVDDGNATSLILMNDKTHRSDKTFENMRSKIILNADRIFVPEVAKAIKEHFSK